MQNPNFEPFRARLDALLKDVSLSICAPFLPNTGTHQRGGQRKRVVGVIQKKHDQKKLFLLTEMIPRASQSANISPPHLSVSMADPRAPNHRLSDSSTKLCHHCPVCPV